MLAVSLFFVRRENEWGMVLKSQTHAGESMHVQC